MKILSDNTVTKKDLEATNAQVALVQKLMCVLFAVDLVVSIVLKFIP